MKTLLTLVVLGLASSALAGVADIEPSKDQLKPSIVEKVIVLQKESSEQPAIRLVLVDNGGSTDVSSLMSPSRLYLALHKDGEMFDVDGSYLLSDAVAELKVESFDAKKGDLRISFTAKNDHLETQKHFQHVYLADALNEAKNPQSDSNGNFEMKSTIGLKEWVP